MILCLLMAGKILRFVFGSPINVIDISRSLFLAIEISLKLSSGMYPIIFDIFVTKSEQSFSVKICNRIMFAGKSLSFPQIIGSCGLVAFQLTIDLSSSLISGN